MICTCSRITQKILGSFELVGLGVIDSISRPKIKEHVSMKNQTTFILRSEPYPLTIDTSLRLKIIIVSANLGYFEDKMGVDLTTTTSNKISKVNKIHDSEDFQLLSFRASKKTRAFPKPLVL